MFFAIENVGGGGFTTPPGLAVGSGLACPERPDRTPRAKRFRARLNFVSVRKKSGVCFVQLTEILIEPLFRLEQVPKRRKFEGRAQFARGDADGGRRGRANSALPYNGKTNGVGRRIHAGEDTSELPAAANAPAV
jgi:hypothetical protein